MRWNKKRLHRITCPLCSYKFHVDRAAGVVTCPSCLLEMEVGVPQDQHYMERGRLGIAPRRPSSRRRIMRRGIQEWDE